MHSWAKHQKHAKNLIQEIREIDLCLQRFDKFCICSACNDRKRKLCEIAETIMEKLVKTHCMNLFSESFRGIQS